MTHLKLILPFPADWIPGTEPPESLQSALQIAQKHIPGCLAPDVIGHSNALIFSLEDVDDIEKGFLIHQGAIGGYGFVEPIDSVISMDQAWVSAVSETEAMIVKRRNSWAI